MPPNKGVWVFSGHFACDPRFGGLSGARLKGTTEPRMQNVADLHRFLLALSCFLESTPFQSLGSLQMSGLIPLDKGFPIRWVDSNTCYRSIARESFRDSNHQHSVLVIFSFFCSANRGLSKKPTACSEVGLTSHSDKENQ